MVDPRQIGKVIIPSHVIVSIRPGLTPSHNQHSVKGRHAIARECAGRVGIQIIKDTTN